MTAKKRKTGSGTLWTRACAPEPGRRAFRATFRHSPREAPSHDRGARSLVRARSTGHALGAALVHDLVPDFRQGPARMGRARVEAVIDLGFNDRTPGFQAEGLAFTGEGSADQRGVTQEQLAPVGRGGQRTGSGPAFSRPWPCPASWVRARRPVPTNRPR